APAALTACALLGRLLPGVEALLEAPARDLWRLAELHLPSGGPQGAKHQRLSSGGGGLKGTVKLPQPGLPPSDWEGHALQEFCAPGGGLTCGVCGVEMLP
ncbi:unnamed protein product, partial [Polarella glacialis]